MCPKNPSQRLEELRRNSLLEVQHLKSPPESSGRHLSQRDMPAHAAPLPQHKATSPTETRDGASDAKAASGNGSEQSSSFFTTTSSSVTGESLTTVPEEPSSLEASRELGENDVYSPRATQVGPTVATLEAEIAGQATTSGKPLFAEPDFAGGPGPVVLPDTVDDLAPVAPEILRRSPGSFSADKLREGEAISPTER